MRQFLGAKRCNFLIRGADAAAAGAVAQVKSCQSAAPRPPRGRLGSKLDMGSRLRRMRGRFDQWIQIKTGPQQCADNYYDSMSVTLAPRARRLL